MQYKIIRNIQYVLNVWKKPVKDDRKQTIQVSSFA